MQWPWSFSETDMTLIHNHLHWCGENFQKISCRYRRWFQRYFNFNDAQFLLFESIVGRSGGHLKNTDKPALQWRHNGHNSLKSPASILFAQPFIQTQIKENIKAPRHWPLCREFTQMASNAENVSIWWRHHVNLRTLHFHIPKNYISFSVWVWYHSVESPSMVDPQWNIWYWGSKRNLHTVYWGAVGYEWGTTSVYFGITYVCFIPSWLPVFAVEPQYRNQDFLFLLKISFEGHIQNL